MPIKKKKKQPSHWPSKKKQSEEILKCGTDVRYFIKNYVRVDHPKKGLVKFKTFPFQDDCLDAFMNHRYIIVNKSRQLGLSTSSAAYSLWLALFRRSKNILVVATKLATAQNFVKKVRTMYKSLPMWLIMPDLVEDNKTSLSWSNSSTIKAVPCSADAGRSEALSLLIVDEAAHIEGIDEMWLGIQPTLSTGGGVIMISSPSGVGTLFHRLWVGAQNGKNDFHAIELPWTVHPERDEKWFEKESRALFEAKGQRGIAQELLCVGDQTNIMTLTGCEKACDIRIGDKVLTHSGKFKKVINVNQRELKSKETLFKVSAPGNRKDPLYITSNHPILNYHFHLPKGKNQHRYLLEQIKNGAIEATFDSIDDLNRFAVKTNKRVANVLHPMLSDSEVAREPKLLDMSKLLDDKTIQTVETNYCRYYRQNSAFKTKRWIETDYELGKFVGLCAAEGCLITNHSQKNKQPLQTLQLAFKTSEELNTLGKFTRDFLEKNGIQYAQRTRSYSDCFTISTCNKYAVALYKKYITLGDATKKRLRLGEVLSAGDSFVRGYLAGHFAGDGDHFRTLVKHNNGNKIKLVSASEKLLYQIRTMLSLYGHYGRIGHWNNRPKYIELDGLKNSYNSFDQVLESGRAKSLEQPTSRIKALDLTRQIVGNVQWEEVDHDRVKFVVDIEVEGDHSFIAQSLVVHNCSFQASGDTFLNGDAMDWLMQSIEEPIEKIPHGRYYAWIWEKPNPGCKYVISADVARGDGDDFSTFHIINETERSIVADFKGKQAPDEFANMLVKYGKMYNNALICQELNNVGVACAQTLKESGYANVYYEKFQKNIYMSYVSTEIKSTDYPGFTMSQTTREQILARLENDIRNKNLKIRSKRVFEEFQTFIWKGNKPQAQKGHNDDLIMALAIGSNLVQFSNGSHNAQDVQWAMLAGMSRSESRLNTVTGRSTEESHTSDGFFKLKKNKGRGISLGEHVEDTQTPLEREMDRNRAKNLTHQKTHDYNSPHWDMFRWLFDK